MGHGFDVLTESLNISSFSRNVKHDQLIYRKRNPLKVVMSVKPLQISYLLQCEVSAEHKEAVVV
jgi:hypothetical protein